MNARTQSLLVVLLGAALLRIGCSDILLRFVRPSARVWVLAAGIVLLLLAAWSLLADVRTSGAGEQCDAHGHAGTTWLAWLVAAPVVAVLVITPAPLGAFSADRRTSLVTATSPGGSDDAPLPAGNPVPVTMFDLATRAVLGHGVGLRGRSLRVTGFVAGRHGGELVLARLVITCCAADAEPVFLRVRRARTSLPRDAWVEVVGAYAGLSADGSDVPLLTANSLRRVSPPADPYD